MIRTTLSSKFLAICIFLGGQIFQLQSQNSIANNHFLPKNTTVNDILISEVAEGDNQYYGFIELYNPTASTINLATGAYYLSIETSPGNINNVALSGEIPANSSWVATTNGWLIFGFYFDVFNFKYGFTSDQKNNSWELDGYDAVILFKGGPSGSGTRIDLYGELGLSGNGRSWQYVNAHAVRKRDVLSPNSTWNQEEWVLVAGESSQMTPKKHRQSLTWTGTTSTNWNAFKPGNFSGSNYVPDASDNVTIPSTTNKPVINGASACNNLQINSGASLTIAPAKTLMVNGTLTNNAGTAGLVLQASASGPSSLIHSTDNVPATVQSYFASLNKWYLISPPISNAWAEMFVGQYLDYWDEQAGQWQSIDYGATALNAGTGYSLKKTGSNTATYEGYLNNGDITVDELTRTESTIEANRGWNLVGNPYPSVIDINALDFGEDLVAAVSVWPHLGSTSSSYISWSKGSGGNTQARYVQPGQGFMVRATVDNQSLTFTNSARTHSGLSGFDKQEEPKEMNRLLKITLSSAQGMTDETFVGFREGATHEFDNYYDVHKLFGAANLPHIFSYTNPESSVEVSIQSFPPPEEGEVIHLGIRPGMEGNFIMQFLGVESFGDEYSFTLLDKKLNQMTSINHSSQHEFTHQNGDEENRFDIFADLINVVPEFVNDEAFFAYWSDNHLYLFAANNSISDYNLQIYNLIGQKIWEESVDEQTTTINLPLPSAWYILRVENDKGTQAFKVFKSN